MNAARLVSLIAAAFLCSCGPPSKKATGAGADKPVRPSQKAAKAANVQGIWTGQVSETGVKEPYPVTVAVTCLDEGKFCGTTTYPKHKCGGRLLYYGVAVEESSGDDDDADLLDKVAKVHAFTEILSHGEEHCADRGRLLLTPGAEDTVGFSWIDARDADHRATATLRRGK